MPRLNPRRSARRRAVGFTLAEVLIVLMILGIVGTAVFKVLLKQQQAYRDTARQADMQREIRLTGSFLPAELRSTSSAGGDILAMAEDKVEFLANTGSSVICEKPTLSTIYLPPLNPAGITLTNWYSQPVVGDSVFLFNDGLDAGTVDDTWERSAVSAVGSSSGWCTGAPYAHPTLDGGKLRYSITLTTVLPDSVKVGNVVRFARPVRYQLYSASSGKWYVGLQERLNNAWTSIEAVGGPFRPFAANDSPLSGLQFRYFDSLGVRLTSIGQAKDVSRVDVYLRTNAGMSAVTERQPNDLRDSVMMRIAVRNFK